MTGHPTVHPGRTRSAGRTHIAPAVVAGAAVAAQLVYPLSDGRLRDVLTVGIVVLLAAATLAHAAVTRGGRTAALLLLSTAAPALLAEIVGVHSGVPFGEYAYTGPLGPRLFGVPVIVALAWTMLAWPAALAARWLVAGRIARVLVGAWALAAADLFLDPQLVAGGYWTWRHPAPHLPGVPDVPLTNLGGWLLVALALSALLQRLLDRDSAGGPAPDDRLPLALYVWLWLGWTVALAGFQGRPAAAAWGAVGMGTVALPLLLRRPLPLRRRE